MFFLAEFFEKWVCKWSPHSPDLRRLSFSLWRWPPHSPDLSPLDFFQRSYLKNIVYKDAPRHIAERKKKIKDVITEINTTMCRMVFTNLLKRASSCLIECGHFQHLLWFKSYLVEIYTSLHYPIIGFFFLVPSEVTF